MSDALLKYIEGKLNVMITNVSSVTGGDINRVYKLQSHGIAYLLKVNDRYVYPDMFLKEREGLLEIKKTNSIAVPEVILQDDFENDSFLILQWVHTALEGTFSLSGLGRQLAQMHRSTNPSFGFYADNYMGSLTQCNNWYANWSDFFIEQRLQPMVKMTVDKKQLSQTDVHRFEQLYKKLPEWFAEEPPSLIHGDLWGGNYLIASNQIPYLIDPAVSYGNREFDIAMTTLFGGFDRSFYDAYQNEFPLQTGWQKRLKLWNLYPLLVHVNLFGGSYVSQVRQSLSALI